MRDESAGNVGFPPTSWVSLFNLAHARGDAARQAISRLLLRYLPALRAHLIYHQRLKADAADDLLQGFVASKILEQNLLAKADPHRGRLRNLLLSSLDHYVSSTRRADKRAKRSPGAGHLNDITDDQIIPSNSSIPSEAFEIAWAKQSITEALNRMKEECSARGRLDLWQLFQGRVVQPAIEGTAPVPYEQLVQQSGFQTPAQATNALVTAKRMFVRNLRSVVAEYAQSDAEIDEEVVFLKASLAKARKSDPAAE